MKKLLLLSALLIFACSSDSEGNDCIYEPTLSTEAVTEITETSATLNGVISIVSENCDIALGGMQGFVYSTNPSPTNDDNVEVVYGTDISTTIDNLIPNTTYYVRVFITNSLGEFYGNEMEFTTEDDNGEPADCDVVYLDENGVTIETGLWITGYPTETEEDHQETIKLLRGMKHYVASGTVVSMELNQASVIRGTPLGDWSIKNNIIFPNNHWGGDHKFWFNPNNPGNTLKVRVARVIEILETAIEVGIGIRGLKGRLVYSKKLLEIAKEIYVAAPPKIIPELKDGVWIESNAKVPITKIFFFIYRFIILFCSSFYFTFLFSFS